MKRLWSLEEWRKAARDGEPPADASLRKQFIADQVKAEGGDSRKVSFTISTGAVDRDRDTIAPDGWRLENYRKNPVVLWAHMSYGLPIARAESVNVSAGALKARAEFVSAEVYPLAETVLQMLKGGFLKATSVGFVPMKSMWNDERGGMDFVEQELLEFSIVPVPANPEALQDAKAAGTDVKPILAWAEGILDDFEPGLWVPKQQAAAAFKALAEPRVVVPTAFDPGPVLAEFQKRGRVLSAANEARIRTAADAASAVGAALDEVLAQVAQEDDAKAAPVLYIAPAETYSIDPKDVQAAVVAAVSESVREQINHARGRLD